MIAGDLADTNNDAEWAAVKEPEHGDWDYIHLIGSIGEPVARAVRSLLRLVAERIKDVEAQINQDVKTTASPTFVGLSATNVNAVTALKVNGTKVVGTQQASWQTMLGAADTESQLDTGNPSLTLGELAQRVKGIQDCLATHGMILEDI